MTIRAKLLFVFLVLASVMLMNGLTALYLGKVQQADLHNAKAHVESLIDEFIPLEKSLRDLQVDVIQVQQFLTDAAATHNSESFSDAAKYADNFKIQIAKVREGLEKIAAPDDADLPAQAKRIADIRTSVDDLEVSFAEFDQSGIIMAKTYISQSIDAGNELMEKFDPQSIKLFEELEGILVKTQGFMKEQSQAVEAAVDTSGETASKLIMAVLVGVVLGLFVLAVTTIFVIRGISEPLASLIKVMKELAAGELATPIDGTARPDEIGRMSRALQIFKENGLALRSAAVEAELLKSAADHDRLANDAFKKEEHRKQMEVVASLAHGLAALATGMLTIRIPNAFAPEYEELRRDFNATAESQQRTMQTMNSLGDKIKSSAHEIAGACNDLSMRTERQASSLAETSSALNEITSIVKKTSEGAIHARGVVGLAKGSAEQSETVVNQAVDAMHALESSSQQITQIIDVIDEIAFQTNLLALNAGVEAARAGEAGRGFAVVATEVRALAQRSAKAAKEIKALISSSTSKVTQGVELVEATGTALNQIVAQVVEIDRIISQITASAQDQAIGLAEINSAVGQMDRVTQQNAAMAVQSTAASQTLADEIGELANLIAAFDVGSEKPISSRAA